MTIVQPFITGEAQARLQAAMNKITEDTKRWGQNLWCGIPGGIDNDVKVNEDGTATYHDVVLPAEMIDAVKLGRDSIKLPVADCGTSYCLAGHVAVQNGYTFVGHIGDDSANAMVRTLDLGRYLRSGYHERVDMERYAEYVGTELLGLKGVSDGTCIFDGCNTLLQLWAMAYALTGGTITLPEGGLPEHEYESCQTGNVITEAEIPAGELPSRIDDELRRLYRRRDIAFIGEFLQERSS
jgi:hypothetical protein